MNAQAMMNKIKDGQLDDAFRRVYVTDGEVAKQKSRYMELLTTFAETFGGDREVHLCPLPDARRSAAITRTTITARCWRRP